MKPLPSPASGSARSTRSSGATWTCSRGCSRTRHRRSEEHTSELQSRLHLVCRLLLEQKNAATYQPLPSRDPPPPPVGPRLANPPPAPPSATPLSRGLHRPLDLRRYLAGATPLTPPTL